MIDMVTARRLGTLERLLEQSVEIIEDSAKAVAELRAQNALQEAQIMKLHQRLLDCEKGTPVVRLKGRRT